MQVQFGAGTATYHVDNLSMYDYFNIPNALFHFAPPASATVSFEVTWSGVTGRTQIGDPSLPFTADIVYTEATMSWTATTGGTTFQSDAASTSQSVFAELGHERNGVFASGD